MITFALMRHGEAQDDAPADCLRELTEQGKSSVTELAKRIQSEQGRGAFNHIVCSPYVRAQQTARIMATYFDITTFEYNGAITPDSHVADAGKSLVDIKDKTLVICHMPIISVLTSYLTHGNTSARFSYQLNELVFFETEFFELGLATKGKHYV